MLSTTTSTENSGLLDYLLSDFEPNYSCDVEVVAVGTGAALENGRNGNADLLLVHARDLELEFVRDGYGYHRVTFMYNKFFLVGPKDDPVGISTAAFNNITHAFELCASSCDEATPFISRGDNSGTHFRERMIWNETSFKQAPDGSTDKWYKESGDGMSATLTLANELGGYTLTDSGTWYSLEDQLVNLRIVVENDETGILMNPYSFILINKTLYPHVNQELAELFVAWCLSPHGQAKINNFTINGHQLFMTCWNDNSSLEILKTNPEDRAFWEQKIVELGLA
ncbi:MAG: substrate-binding domain-containing protein [Promethearchaeota archaeon]